MLEGTRMQLPVEIDGNEARAGVYLLVAGHDCSFARTYAWSIDIPFGSRQDAWMKRLFLQLR
jgi:hypothetical protein